MSSMKTLCSQVQVIPVLVVKEVAHAKPLAEALVRGGLTVLEVTLRTPVALEVIRAMSEVPGAQVGAGTVLTAEDVRAVKKAGAQFAVAPGATASLIKAAQDADLPLLPGAATASEVMHLMEQGFDMLKFFPAEAAGGASMLKALHGPLSGVCFCPTGGVNVQNAPQYLSLPNVVCVGGSWVTPEHLVAAGDWQAIEQLAREAQAL